MGDFFADLASELSFASCFFHFADLGGNNSVNKEKSQNHEAEVKNFPNNASWDDIREHCITEHPSECEEVVKLAPAQMCELRRRLRARQSSA